MIEINTFALFAFGNLFADVLRECRAVPLLLAMLQDFGSDYESVEPLNNFWIAVIILMNVAWIALFVVLGVRNHRKELEYSKLLRDGEEAPARILQIWETGESVGDRPEIGLRLEVAPAGRAVYQTEIKIFASILQILRLQPQATVSVKFDPENPSRVALAL